MSKQGTVVKALLLAGALAALAASGAAKAGSIWDADPAYPAPTPYPVYDWTGFYVGVNGGETWGRAAWTSDPDLLSGTVPGSSGFVGGTIGYNEQNLGLGRIVIGEEFDFNYRKFDFTIPAPTCVAVNGTNCALTTDWFATARIRFGYSIDRFLPYVTGGVSMGGFTADIIGRPFGLSASGYVTYNWTGGGGIEFVLAGPLTGKLEYLYVNHTNEPCVLQCNGPIHMGLSESVFRAGLNYRLWDR